MNRPTCKTCLYWCEYEEDTDFGQCRRYPPALYDDEALQDFPETVDDKWCGEHSDFPEYIAAMKASRPIDTPVFGVSVRDQVMDVEPSSR